ncbi:hypothetical protein FC831_13910 [Clostridium botulinum]|nr:hypothetical protein [Clostridium botulinum]
MINILNVKENKVSVNLGEYPIVLMSEKSGDGKTFSFDKLLRDLLPQGDSRKPLFIMLEDRYQHIPNIMAVRVRDIPELLQVKAQLLTPQAKEMFSCVIIDTADKLDTMMEKYIADSKEVEITGELQFGKGNKYIKNKLYIIDELRNNGWTVHFTCQCAENTNIITQKTTYTPKLNKETWAKISQDAYLIGMLKKDPKSQERLITFNKTSEYTELKDSLNMPKIVKVSEFAKVLKNAILSIDGAEFTEEKTISKEVKEEVSFDDLIKRGNDLGKILFENGKSEEAFNILRTNIGVKNPDTKEPKMFSDILPTQIELAKVVVIKLEELSIKYKLL